MPDAHAQREPDQDWERIEESILPSLSLVLDSLLDSAALARPGKDAEAFAAGLRTLGVQLEALTRQVEAASGAVGMDPLGYRAAAA